MSAYERGFKAYADGKNLFWDNPYDWDVDEFTEWERGWFDCKGG